MLAEWPRPTSAGDASAEAEWSDIMAVTRAARTLRADYRIEPSNVVGAAIAARGPRLADFWRGNAELLGALPGTRLKPIDVIEVADGVDPELAARSIAAVAGGAELLIPAAGLFDVQTELKRAAASLREQGTRLAVAAGHPKPDDAQVAAALPPAVGAQLAALSAQITAQEASRVALPHAMAVTDSGPTYPAFHLLVRGDADHPGPTVQPGFIVALPGGDADVGPAVPGASTTGRRLAEDGARGIENVVVRLVGGRSCSQLDPTDGAISWGRISGRRTNLRWRVP